MTNKTIEYYNENAESYSNSTINLNLQNVYKDFLKYIPENGKILDVGCGSGRDSLHFKNLGYKVVALDASKELADKASKYIGQEVIFSKIEDITFKNSFDAVWCMASLVHLNNSELDIALEKISQAIKPQGSFYASFKVGEGEEIDSKNRYFNYIKEENIVALLNKHNLGKNVSLNFTNDELGRPTAWLNVYSFSEKLKLKNTPKNPH